MTQSYAVSLNRHSGDRNSGFGSATATKRRLSFDTCTTAEQWTSSGVLPCASNTCAIDGAAGALPSAMASSSPKKCMANSSVSLSMGPSAATGTQMPAVDGPCAQELWPDNAERASHDAMLPSAGCFAARSASAMNGEGSEKFSECCDPASATGEKPEATQACPCMAGMPYPPRAQPTVINGATTASDSPHTETPPSTANASPTRNSDCNSAGVLTPTSEKEDAPREFRAVAEKHTMRVMGASFEGEPAYHKSAEAAVSSKEAILVEDTARNASYRSTRPCGNCVETSLLSQGGEEQATDSTSSCVWSEEVDSATASEAQSDLSAANTAIPAPLSAGPRLNMEIGDIKATALEATNARLARGVSSHALPEDAAVRAVPLATSEETERRRENATAVSKELCGRVRWDKYGEVVGHSNRTMRGEIDRIKDDASSITAPAPTSYEGESFESSQQAHHIRSAPTNDTNPRDDTTHHPSSHEDTGTINNRGERSSSTSETVIIRADTHKISTPIEARTTGRLSDKLRAKFKREFNRSWVDINSAPSWPPIKKTKYLTSDWKIVDLRVGAAQRHEKKKHRLFLNSLCYLFDGVYTQKSTLGRKAGLGLFCERSEGFRKGQIITEFVGWLVDREQAESYRKQRAASHIVAVQKGFLYIDGAKEPTYGMGGGSFANDGSEFLGGPGNNAHFYHWFDDELGRTRVFIRATADIKSGQEIFVPYERTYWLDNFEEQAENCPEPFRKKKLEQLHKKIRHREELHKNRVAANGRQHGSCCSATSLASRSQEARLWAKQKLQQQTKGKNREKSSNSHPAVKRPLSAYMLFSKERRRELLLQHYRPPSEAPQQVEETSVRALRNTTFSTTTSDSKNHNSPRQLQTPALKSHELKGRGTPAFPKIKSQYEISDKDTSNNAPEQQVSRLRSRRNTDTSAPICNKPRGADGRFTPVVLTAGNEGAVEKIRNNGTIQKRPVDVPADADNLVTAGVSLSSSSLSGKEDPATGRTRRRSDRLLESTAARSFCIECTSTGETGHIRVESEQEVSMSPTKKRRKRIEEVVNVEMTGQTMSEWDPRVERNQDKRDTAEFVKKDVAEGRRRSPRWQQSSCTAQLPAAVAVPDAEAGTCSVNNDCEAQLEEISAGRPRSDEMVRATDQATPGCNRKELSMDSTETDCAASIGKPVSPVLRRRVYESSLRSGTTARWQSRKRSVATRERVERPAVAPDSAEGRSAVHVGSTSRGVLAKSGCEEKLELKKKHKEAGVGDELSGAHFSDFPRMGAAGLDKRNAVLQCFASVIRQVASEWTGMPARERRKWERLAMKERERYMRLRQKASSKKGRRRCGAEQSLPCKKKKSGSKNTAEKIPSAYRIKAKATPMAQVAAAPVDFSQKLVSPKELQSARSVVAAATTDVDRSLQSAHGNALPETTEEVRSRKRARAYDTLLTRTRRIIPEVDGHTAKNTERNGKAQADSPKQAEANKLKGRRCLTRAAKRAAGGASDQSLPDHKHRFPQDQKREEQDVKTEKSRGLQQNEGQQHHCESAAAQQVRRGRRHGGMTPAAETEDQADADSVSRKRQHLFLTYNSVSSVTSCSTTRSSSSRNSSCESRNHRDRATTHQWQSHENEGSFALSPKEGNDASIQFDSVCEMLRDQQSIEQQEGGEKQRSPQQVHDKLKRNHGSQHPEEVVDSLRRHQQQQRERSQQRETGKTQETCLRQGDVLLRSRELRTRSTKLSSSSPVCVAPVHYSSPSANQDIHEKRAYHTVSVAPADELSSYVAGRKTQASPVAGTETKKTHDATVRRRRSGGYSTRESGSRTD